MILKNLMRRKIRTLLTMFGIALGVSVIILLGAMGAGIQAGYGSIITGTKADLILSQPDAIELSYSSVDESIGAQLNAMPEVESASAMIQGFLGAEGAFYFFVFGYPEDSFLLEKFQIIEGFGFNTREAAAMRGKPMLLGSAAASALKKKTGDTLRMGDFTYRVIGIYQTGDAFEDSGGVLPLDLAQGLLGKPRQVSLFYIRLKDLALKDRLQARINRTWPELDLSGTREFADKQTFDDMMNTYVWVIAGFAILLGGVGMMNAQLMAVFERTREIGVLRAVGWNRRRILLMILGESILVCLIGGVLGVGIGWVCLYILGNFTVMMGMNASSINPGLILQALTTVIALGITGGLYPAVIASRLQPIEAIRYEGGSAGGRVHRMRFGGMAAQSLRQRTTRTVLTLVVIAITIGSIIALQAVTNGMSKMMGVFAVGSDAELLVRQANISDTSTSAIDERFMEKIAALPDVAGAAGIMFTAVLLPENGSFFIIQGYNPRDFAIQRFNIVEGNQISNNRQILLGKFMARSLNKGIGDTLILSGYRFRVVGIYESSVGWEEIGGVTTLRDAQAFMGRPKKVTLIAVKLKDPQLAPKIVDRINREIPEVHVALAGEFAEQMPDMQAMDVMMAGIAFLAIVVGGLGVMNTMLMSVFERTREIGVLRALGWRRRAVLQLIIEEASLLGLIGGVCGVLVGVLLGYSYLLFPSLGDSIKPIWTPDLFFKALVISFILGLVGGGYPAYHATRLQPVEALRYE